MNFSLTNYIDVATGEEVKAVRAREMYKGLELDPTNYARWEKKILSEYVENEDFVLLVIKDEYKKRHNLGNKATTDLILSLNTAKHEAMKSGSPKGKEVRQYFIDCEKELRSKFSIPKTYSQALMLAAKQAEQIELQQQQLAVQAPKVEYFDKLVDRKLNLCLRDTAKAIKVKQNVFIKFLEDNKYLYRNNKKQLRPYANSKAEGLFEVKEFSNEKYSSTQVLVTPKGRQTFMMLLNKEQRCYKH